jgi:hypothetical protein
VPGWHCRLRRFAASLPLLDALLRLLLPLLLLLLLWLRLLLLLLLPGTLSGLLPSGESGSIWLQVVVIIIVSTLLHTQLPPQPGHDSCI